VDALKQQLESAQSAARDSLAEAETAQANLSASETSWKQQKSALDKEVSDLNSRYEFQSAASIRVHLDYTDVRI
jgi:nucleoprotein TPR